MGIITRQVGPNAKGSSLTYAEMDNNLIYLDEQVSGSNGYISFFSGSNNLTSSIVYQSSSAAVVIGGTISSIGDPTLTVRNGGITIAPDETSYALTVYNATNDSIPFRVGTDGDAVWINAPVEITGSTKIIGSLNSNTASVDNDLTITGSIINEDIVNLNITSSGTNSNRVFTVNLSRNNNIPLTNKRQLIHWWTSTSLYGAASALSAQTYAVSSGSNVNSVASNSINHAVTDSNGQFVLTLTNAGGGTPINAFFHAEVQGVIGISSGSVDTGGA